MGVLAGSIDGVPKNQSIERATWHGECGLARHHAWHVLNYAAKSCRLYQTWPPSEIIQPTTTNPTIHWVSPCDSTRKIIQVWQVFFVRGTVCYFFFETPSPQLLSDSSM